MDLLTFQGTHKELYGISEKTWTPKGSTKDTGAQGLSSSSSVHLLSTTLTFHRVRFLTINFSSFQDFFIDSTSFLAIVLKVIQASPLGRLLAETGFNSIAFLAIQLSFLCKAWPIHLHFWHVVLDMAPYLTISVIPHLWFCFAKRWGICWLGCVRVSHFPWA